MSGKGFIVVAWNNSAHHASGAGYGLKMSAADRDVHIKRERDTVDLYLPGRPQPAIVNVNKSSFWSGNCRELISREIGTWLISHGMTPWPKGNPPKFMLIPLGARKFEVRPSWKL
jgi:hypothetical protein